MPNVEGVIALLADVIGLARREKMVLTAASIAYFSFVSVVPLLLLVIVAVWVFGDATLAVGVVNRATLALAPGNAVLLQRIVFNAADRQRATVISAVILLWGALLTFRGLNTAFAGIYGTYGEASIYEVIADVVLVLVVIVLVVVAIMTAGLGVSLVIDARIWKTFGPLVLWVVLTAVFFPLYYILPDVDIDLTEALPGAVFAAGAWTILQAVFGYYTAISMTTQLYGTASAFLLILLWLYVGGFVLLLGAALNAVLAGHTDPDDEWVPTE